MSTKSEGMFAKLAAQQAKVVEDDPTPVATAAAEEPPPSPTPPAVERLKRHSSKAKAEPVRGKREHPDYCQANSYVPKKLRRAVDRELLDLEGMDYSTLVEDLLRKWLKSRGVSA